MPPAEGPDRRSRGPAAGPMARLRAVVRPSGRTPRPAGRRRLQRAKESAREAPRRRRTPRQRRSAGRRRGRRGLGGGGRGCVAEAPKTPERCRRPGPIISRSAGHQPVIRPSSQISRSSADHQPIVSPSSPISPSSLIIAHHARRRCPKTRTGAGSTRCRLLRSTGPAPQRGCVRPGRQAAPAAAEHWQRPHRAPRAGDGSPRAAESDRARRPACRWDRRRVVAGHNREIQGDPGSAGRGPKPARRGLGWPA